MKRVISLIISIAMVASLATGLAISGFAAEGVFYTNANGTESSDDPTGKILKFTVSGTDEVSVAMIDTNQTQGEITIPTTVTNGTIYAVTSIDNQAFESCHDLTNITIPGSVKTIGNNAFNDCKGLTSVTITDGVTSIGNRAFFSCNSLTNITIPGSVETIGDNAFNGCSALTSVTIPGSVKTIGKNAFAGCTGLTSVKIPDSVESIGNYAFNGCSSLTYVQLPNRIEKIDDFTFKDCKSLKSIKIPSGITSIGKQTFNGCSGLTSVTIPSGVTSIGDGAFYQCSSLKRVTIPSSVTNIGMGTFYQCSSLESVTIGSGVKTIGQMAFQSCTDLTTVIVEATTPPTLTNNAFNGCTSLKKIYVPAESVEAYKSATNWGTYIDDIFAISADVVDEEETEENDPEVELDLGYGPVTVKTSNNSVVFNDTKVFEASIGDGDVFIPIDLSSAPKKIDGLFFNNEVYKYIDNAGKDIKIINRFAYAEVYTNKEIGLNPLSLHLSDVSEIAGTCATAIQKKAMETSKVYAEVNYSFVSNGKPTDNNAKIYVPVDGPAKVFYLFNAEKIGIVPCEVKDGYCVFNRYFDGTYVICSK